MRRKASLFVHTKHRIIHVVFWTFVLIDFSDTNVPHEAALDQWFLQPYKTIISTFQPNVWPGQSRLTFSRIYQCIHRFFVQRRLSTLSQVMKPF